VLWDAGPQATTASIIRLLRTRFGNELQAERFKAELRARWRKPGEPLQQLYLDISRVVALAYLLSESALVNHVAKEAFVMALSLDDTHLQLKLMEREPKTVAWLQSWRHETSLSLPGKPDEADEGRRRRKPKKMYSTEGEEAEVNSSLH